MSKDYTDDPTVEELVDDFEDGEVLEDLFETLEKSRLAREREVKGGRTGKGGRDLFDSIRTASELTVEVDSSAVTISDGSWCEMEWEQLIRDAQRGEYKRGEFEVHPSELVGRDGFSMGRDGVPSLVRESDGECSPYESFSTPIDPKMAEQVLERLYDCIQKREREGYDIDHVVIGMPQYRILEPWAQSEYEMGAAEIIPVEQVTTVPGPMMYPVIPSRHLFHEHLKERE